MVKRLIIGQSAVKFVLYKNKLYICIVGNHFLTKNQVYMENLNLQICEMYLNGASLNSLSKQFNKSSETIKKILKENNIEITQPWIIRSESIKEKIRNLYIKEMLSPKKIGNILNLGEKAIRVFLKSEGIYEHHRNKKYRCNSSFFSKIDSEVSAYWLGVLFADGNIAKDSSTIRFSSVDKEWVGQFLKSIEATNPLCREFHVKFKKDIWKARISDRLMWKDLYNLGCVPAKSLIIKFPELDAELIPHFIRGYFDGDGCVSICNNSSKKENCTTLHSGFCTGSKVFLEELIKYLPVRYRTISSRKDRDLFDVKFSVKDSYALYKYMYTGATIFLKRKRDKFEEYMKQRHSETIIAAPIGDKG